MKACGCQSVNGPAQWPDSTAEFDALCVPPATVAELEALPDKLRRVAPSSEAMLLAVDKTYLDLLPAAEKALVANAAPIRQIQFASGRVAARDALRKLGESVVTLQIGSMREPLWPEGIVGTITHTNRWALAWVARQSHHVGLGVDLEHATQLPDRAWSMILSEAEQRWTKSCTDRQLAATVLFSVKESIYKAVFPTVRRFVDFDEIELAFDPDDRLIARPAAQLSAELRGLQLQSDFIISDDSVASWAMLIAAGNG